MPKRERRGCVKTDKCGRLRTQKQDLHIPVSYGSFPLFELLLISKLASDVMQSVDNIEMKSRVPKQLK